MSCSPLETFRGACGFLQPLNVQILDARGGGSRPATLDRPSALIGRHPLTDVCLDSQSVSRRHAYVQFIAGQPFVVDLGSRTGTRWHGKAQHAGWLASGGSLGIGEFSVQVGFERPEADAGSFPDWNPLETDAQDRFRIPEITLELAGKVGTTRRLRLDPVLTLVGRDEACKLRLDDRSVSSFHCALLQIVEGLWIVDLLGKDGVVVDGRRVRWARLDDQARVEVGRFAIRVWHGNAGNSAPAGQFFQALSIAEQRIAGEGNGLFGQGLLPSTGHLTPSPASLGLSTPSGGSLLPMPYQPLAPASAELVPSALPAALMQQFAMLHQQLLGQFQQSMLVMAQMFTALRQEEMELLREVLERVGKLKREVRGLTRKERRRARAKPEADPDEVPESPAGSPESKPDVIAPPAATESPPTNGEVPAAVPTTDADPHFHAWLSERISTLDKERQSAWRRLVATLLGK